MDSRLPAHLEASGLLRRAEAAGGFATIIAKGDPDRGSLVLLIGNRGVHVASLERGIGPAGDYVWQTIGPGPGAEAAELSEWCAKRRRFDADIWLIELDVPLPERFIAETTAIG